VAAAAFNGHGSVTDGGIEEVVHMHSLTPCFLGFHEIVKSFLAERTDLPVPCLLRFQMRL
jgi:hypothetical protein